MSSNNLFSKFRYLYVFNPTKVPYQHDYVMSNCFFFYQICLVRLCIYVHKITGVPKNSDHVIQLTDSYFKHDSCLLRTYFAMKSFQLRQSRNNKRSRNHYYSEKYKIIDGNVASSKYFSWRVKSNNTYSVSILNDIH